MVTTWKPIRYYQKSLHYALSKLLQWDSIRQSWEKIGDVVDAIGQGRKQLYQGKEYDYVFDVDIQDGVPPLKLPYNVTGMLEVQWINLRTQDVGQRTHLPPHSGFYNRMIFPHHTSTRSSISLRRTQVVSA